MTSNEMRRSTRKGLLISAVFLASICLSTEACSQAAAAPRVPAPREIPKASWLAEKAKLAELGKQFPTAVSLYEQFLKLADGGTKHTLTTLPDWSGWYTGVDGFNIDPDQEQGKGPTAKLTPAYEPRLRERMAKTADEGGGFDDRLPFCLPPGFPRYIMEPWGREYVATPKQAWLFSEMGNEVHRVYTDGRGHIPDADAEPTYDGDTIGFWDRDALVAHTTHLHDGLYQVRQPDHTKQLQAVEIWRKVNDTDMVAYLWFYDPPVLAEPWFVRRTYRKDPNTDGFLRVKYYDCKGSEYAQVDERPDARVKFIK